VAQAKKAATGTKKAASISKTKAEKPARKPRRWTKPFRAIGGYFKGAWVELRQVHWPDRRSTWGLTIAVALFSLAFALVILGLDYVFSYLFKEVIL
jgi:preprotein translocase SecE subunit